jgi:alpha-L-arabinofuranosidase
MNTHYSSILVFSVAFASVAGPGGAQTTLTASEYIDATKIQRVIPPTLYGTSLEWGDNGDRAWNPATNAVTPSVLSNWVPLGSPLVRFPSGQADFYHWKNGVGPVGQRPAASPYPNESPEASNFGTDEALSFAAQSGAKLLITANVGTGTAAEAAAWVEYTNGTQPGKVPYWEIGNEIYNTTGYESYDVAIPPATYATDFLQFAQAMRQVDPTIKLAAPGGNLSWLISYPNWDQTVLTMAGSQIDYLAVHNAYFPFNPFQQNLDLRTVYSAMLAAPQWVGQDLLMLSNEIAMWGGARASQIKIAVTEWAPLFTVQPGAYFLHPKTLGSALYVASVLQQFIQNQQTVIANMFSFTNDSVLGQIEERNGVFIPNPLYYALQLYTQHFGTQLVTTYPTVPTYNSPAVGFVPALNNVPYLDVISSLSADGTKLYIMAVNKNFDSPIQTSFAVNGFRPSGSGVAWLLNGTGIDANTGTQWPLIAFFSPSPPAVDTLNPQFWFGSPSAVTLINRTIPSGFAQTFTYTFPAHSVTSLQLNSM